MLTLNDGRSELWQWDTGRTLAVDADCSQVHFSNKVFGRSIDVDVTDGVAIVPDILLQTDKDLNVWAFVGTAENGYTKISKTFKVNRRNKPADYVFTPVEQTTIAEIAAIAQSVRNDADAGMFDGAQGPAGPAGSDGKTPEYGVDYGTPEQIAEIAQQAADIFQPELNQLKGGYKSLSSMFVTGGNVEQEVFVKTINEDDVTWEDGKSIYAINAVSTTESHTIGELSTSSLLKLSDYIDIGNDVSKISITVPTYQAPTNYGTVYYDNGKSVISGRIMNATGSYGIETVEITPPVGTRYIRTCYFKNNKSYHTINFKIDVYQNQIVSVDYRTDTSLSMENKVADAKATGDAIANLNEKIKKATIFYNKITVNASDWVSDSANASDSIEEMIEFSQAFVKRVIVFDMDVTISRAILLPSNTTVILKNCTITQADETFDNVFRGENVILDDNDYVYVPEDISQLKNIKIIGEGNAVINGPSVNKVINSKYAVGHEFGARTHQIDFTNVEGLEIRNITFNRTRGWCIELEFVSHFELSDLVFHTAGVKNGDGIDIRGGCKYGNVYNISGDTGDDTIAFNTHVSLLSSQFSSFPNSTCYYPLEFGYKYNIKKCTQDPTSADIHDVSLNNISKEGGSYHICIFLAMYGHRIYNISMSNLLVSGDVVVPSDYSWVSCYNYGESTYNAGDISGIRVNNYINEATHTGYSGSVAMLYSNLELLDVWVNGLDNKNAGDVLTNLSHVDGVRVTNSKTV